MRWFFLPEGEGFSGLGFLGFLGFGVWGLGFDGSGS